MTSASSFTARLPGGATIPWDDERGFGGTFASLLNDRMALAPGQGVLPRAQVARTVLLGLFPSAVVSVYRPFSACSSETILSDFVSVYLDLSYKPLYTWS